MFHHCPASVVFKMLPEILGAAVSVVCGEMASVYFLSLEVKEVSAEVYRGDRVQEQSRMKAISSHPFAQSPIPQGEVKYNHSNSKATCEEPEL